MLELQPLREDHASAVLEFELANRAYFSASISDRGDDFFARFEEHHRTCLAEQDAGVRAYHVLVEDDGAVVGRFNLYDIERGTAVVGYRVAERVAGHGVASSALHELCELARARYGLHTLWAASSNENLASQRVLEKAGFVSKGTTEVGGRPAKWYERRLAAVGPRRSSTTSRP